MSRRTIGGLGVLVVAASIWVLSALAKVEPEAGKAGAVQPTGNTPAAKSLVPPEGVEAPLRLLGADPETAGLPDPVADDVPPESPVLRVTVSHARGRPASGGRVALYSDRHLIAQGVLDAEGRWDCAGVDSPVEFFVLGLTPAPARFELAVGLGDHDLRLSEGAWLEGVVLINGSPPGRPFPLLMIMKGVSGGFAQFAEFDTRPEPAGMRGQITHDLRGGFFTSAEGRFMISGLEAGKQISLTWPRFYTLEANAASPFPVTTPASSVVLALERPRMIRGRVLKQEGQPEPGARLTLEVHYSMNAPRDSGTGPAAGRAGSTTSSFKERAVSADGRFAIPIGYSFGSLREPLPPDVPSSSIALDLNLIARDTDGNWVRAELLDVDMTLDHDLGDLVLQPNQRVTLRVVDARGMPVAAAKVRPESRRTITSSVTLETDKDGLVVVDLAVATEGHATVIAAGFRAALVELPWPAPEEPLQVVLTPGSSIHLQLRGPWTDDESPEDGWDFRLTLESQGAAYDDGTVTTLPGRDPRHGPDKMRKTFDGWTGAEGTNVYADGRVRYSWWTAARELQIDSLRAAHSLQVRVEITGAPDRVGPQAIGRVWESENLWLTEGERRDLVADLR